MLFLRKVLSLFFTARTARFPCTEIVVNKAHLYNRRTKRTQTQRRSLPKIIVLIILCGKTRRFFKYICNLCRALMCELFNLVLLVNHTKHQLSSRQSCCIRKPKRTSQFGPYCSHNETYIRHTLHASYTLGNEIQIVMKMNI